MTSAIEHFQGELDRIESKVKSTLKSNESIDEFTAQVKQLEFNFDDYENYLMKEMSLLESSFTQMQKGLKIQHQKLVRVLRAIPQDVLESANLAAAANQASVNSSNQNASTVVSKKKSGKAAVSSSSTSSSKAKTVATSTNTAKSTTSANKPPSPKDEKRTSPPPAPPTLDAPVVFRESIDMITKSEFSKIPGYVVGRMTLQKLNEAIGQLNILVQEKTSILRIPESKLVRQVDRDLVYAFKSQQTQETKGLFFITEQELRSGSGGTRVWASGKSKFTYSAAGKQVLTILRTCGRVKEVRDRGVVRYVLL